MNPLLKNYNLLLILMLFKLVSCAPKGYEYNFRSMPGELQEMAISAAEKYGHCFCYITSSWNQELQQFDDNSGYIWYYYSNKGKKYIAIKEYNRGELILDKDIPYNKDSNWIKNFKDEELNKDVVTYMCILDDYEFYYYYKDGREIKYRMILADLDDVLEKPGQIEFMDNIANDIKDYEIMEEKYWHNI